MGEDAVKECSITSMSFIRGCFATGETATGHSLRELQTVTRLILSIQIASADQVVKNGRCEKMKRRAERRASQTESDRTPACMHIQAESSCFQAFVVRELASYAANAHHQRFNIFVGFHSLHITGIIIKE